MIFGKRKSKRFSFVAARTVVESFLLGLWNVKDDETIVPHCTLPKNFRIRSPGEGDCKAQLPPQL